MLRASRALPDRRPRTGSWPRRARPPVATMRAARLALLLPCALAFDMIVEDAARRCIRYEVNEDSKGTACSAAPRAPPPSDG